MSTYWEKLKDPRWQRRRLEIMQRSDFACEECGDTSSTLNVHHKIYRKGHEPWEYTDDELSCLCERCHEIWHEMKDYISELIAGLDEKGIRALAGFGSALVLEQGSFHRCRVGSSAAVTAFAKHFGLTDQQVVEIRDEDMGISLEDVRVAQAERGER